MRFNCHILSFHVIRIFDLENETSKVCGFEMSLSRCTNGYFSENWDPDFCQISENNTGGIAFRVVYEAVFRKSPINLTFKSLVSSDIAI